MVADQEMDALLKRLHLANTRREWRELARRAEQEGWTYHDFLALLVTEEIAHRQQTRLERVVRRARFPFLKTIDDFNFLYQSTVRLSLLGSALSADFTTEGHCLIFNGKPGRGKTHLAIAIAYRAIQHGFDALFVTAAELIDDLSAAFRAGRFATALAPYTHPSVLVVDEVGYLTCGTDAANVLFHVVNDRHRKKRAMIFTTNKPLNQWGGVLHDEDLAHAIVDRVLERGRFLTLDGPSMRTKHLGLDDPTAPEASAQPARIPDRQVIRISGIDAPEFPEPTSAFLRFSRSHTTSINELVIARRSGSHFATTGSAPSGSTVEEISSSAGVKANWSCSVSRCPLMSRAS
ncbi:MAG TPA: IS21-like element helper ATPase IstB [Burkholderiales bacterium]